MLFIIVVVFDLSENLYMNLSRFQQRKVIPKNEGSKYLAAG